MNLKSLWELKWFIFNGYAIFFWINMTTCVCVFFYSGTLPLILPIILDREVYLFYGVDERNYNKWGHYFSAIPFTFSYDTVISVGFSKFVLNRIRHIKMSLDISAEVNSFALHILPSQWCRRFLGTEERRRVHIILEIFLA